MRADSSGLELRVEVARGFPAFAGGPTFAGVTWLTTQCPVTGRLRRSCAVPFTRTRETCGGALALSPGGDGRRPSDGRSLNVGADVQPTTP